MQYLLDTNVLSEIDKPKPDKGLMRWYEEIDISSCYVSCLTLGEITKGIEMLEKSKRKSQLEQSFNNILEAFNNRVLEIDIDTALGWGKIIANGYKKGTPAPVIDALIASQCLQHKMTLVTRNINDFRQFYNLDILCPWL